jgi:hypothetical protein
MKHKLLVLNVKEWMFNPKSESSMTYQLFLKRGDHVTITPSGVASVERLGRFYSKRSPRENRS